MCQPPTPPGLRWGVTFANSRSSSRAFHAFQRVRGDESLRRTILLVEVRVGHAHDVLKGLVVPEEAAFFCSEELFDAGIRNAFDRETGGRP